MMAEKSHRAFGISSFTLKLVAIVGMTLDHIGIIFQGQFPIEVSCFLYAFGGLTFPTMAFLMGEGYHHTSDVRKYAFRLLLFALIAQVPFMIFLLPEGNVLFTLLLGLIVLYCNDVVKNRFAFYGIFAGAIVLSAFCDWGIIGVPMIYLYNMLRGKKLRTVIPYLLVVVYYLLPLTFRYLETSQAFLLPYILYAAVGCTLTVPLLALYRGKKGRPMKYFFYWYYPAHILIIGLIERFLQYS